MLDCMATLDRELSSTELRDDITTVVSSVEHGHARIGVTRHGKLAAVVIGVEDLELLERLEMSADAAAYEAAKTADDGARVDADELFAELGL